jgi:SnoaL-like polyketide cyclase
MPGTATPTDTLKTLAQRFADEIINAQDLDAALADLVVEDFVEQNPLLGQGPGRAGLADVLPTHRGEFLGIPATGRGVTVEAWTLDRYRDGQLTESRLITDVAGLLVQLGVLRLRRTAEGDAGLTG